MPFFLKPCDLLCYWLSTSRTANRYLLVVERPHVLSLLVLRLSNNSKSESPTGREQEIQIKIRSRIAHRPF